MMVVEVYDDVKTTLKYCFYDNQPAAQFPFNFQLVQLRNGTDLIKQEEGIPFEPKGIKKLMDPWIENLPDSCWSNWQVKNKFKTE